MRRWSHTWLAALAPVVGCAPDDVGCDDSVCYDNPPNTVILDPQTDQTFAVDEPISFAGLVADDGPLTSLIVQWLVDDEVAGEVDPDADGRVHFEASIGAAGSHNVGLRAFDLWGNQAMDAVAIEVAE